MRTILAVLILILAAGCLVTVTGCLATDNADFRSPESSSNFGSAGGAQFANETASDSH